VGTADSVVRDGRVARLHTGFAGTRTGWEPVVGSRFSVVEDL